MLGLLRRICSLLAQVLSRVVRPFGSSAVSRESEGVSEERTHDEWGTSEWDKGAEDWEPFTVKVVPSQEDPMSTEPPNEPDLFSDMQPVFKKPTMIRVAHRAGEDRQEAVDLHKFTVQDTAFSEDVSGGLGVWTDEGDGGWDDQDVGDLVKNSKEALRNKRVQEREQRRLQQERMRAQLKTSAHGGLGVRVS